MNNPALPKNKKAKLPKISTVRNKCDALLTPIIQKMFPKCLLCPFTGKDGIPLRDNPTQVAHHHIKKSKSMALRYEFSNLIPLCHQCHRMLHSNESFWSSKLVSLKGKEWFDKLEQVKNRVTVNADVHYFLGQFSKLSTFYENLVHHD